MNDLYVKIMITITALSNVIYYGANFLGWVNVK